MAISESIKGVTDFLQRNEALIDDIVNGVDTLQALAARLDAHEQEGEAVLASLNNVQFAVSQGTSNRQKQQELLEAIADVSKKITDFQDAPAIVANLLRTRASLHMALGNTYNDLVATIIVFSQDEIDGLQVLLRRATLDANARQRRADVLDGAIQISKFGLRLGLKLAA